MEMSKIIKEFRAKDPVCDVEIHWVSGGVTLCVSETNEVYAVQKAARNVPERRQMQVYFTGETLLIEDYNRGMNKISLLQSERTFLYLYLPKGTLRSLSVSGVSNWVTGNEIDTHRLTISMVSGNLRLEGRMRQVDGNAVSGATDLTFHEMPDSVHLKSVSGNGVLRFPPNEGFTLTKSMLSGDVQCTFPCAAGRYGNGKTGIQISGVSCSFRIVEK